MPSARRTARRRPSRAVAAAVATAALVLWASGCSWLGGDRVDLGIAGLTARTVTVPGTGGRTALLGVPDGGAAGDRPLVVVLHGLGGDAEGMARISAWAAAAVQHDLVVAFGEGGEASWNAEGCCGGADAEGTDDVDYLHRLIAHLIATQDVDPQAVFLTGYSNGGMMTYRYLCEHGDELAGAASVAGTNTSGCTPEDPVDLLQISGADDTVVPLAGGPSTTPGIGPFPSVTGSVEAVARAFGCPPERTVTRPPALVTRWGPCRDDVEVGLDVLSGAGHGYPLGSDYVATEEILAFWGLP